MKWAVPIVMLALVQQLVACSPRAAAAGGSAPPVCPKATTAADGCAASNGGGTTQHPNFFAGYANSSGQTYAGRPSWNVAGVDYPVGYYTPLPQMQDATTYHGQGCYTTTQAGGRMVMYCTGKGVLDLKGINFGNPPGAPNGVWLYITGAYSDCTIEDSYFLNGTTSNATEGNLFRLDAGNCTNSITLRNDTFDGNTANLNDGSYLGYLIAITAPNETVAYNAILNCVVKCIVLGTAGGASYTAVEQYNYFEGLGEQHAGAHGEFDILGGGTLTLTRRFNTGLQPANAPTGGGGITALYYTSNGTSAGLYTIVDASNVMVSNLAGGARGAPFVSAMDEYGGGAFAAISVSDNWLDATGALEHRGFVMLNGRCQTRARFSGNQNLVTGRAGFNGWDVSDSSGC